MCILYVTLYSLSIINYKKNKANYIVKLRSKTLYYIPTTLNNATLASLGSFVNNLEIGKIIA